MKKQKMVYWFTIALIVFFVVEFFWPVMYSPFATPSPTPTAQPKQFSGQGVVSARVTKLSNELYVSCNTTVPITNEIRRIPGVINAISVSDLGIVVTANESRVDEVVSAVQDGFDVLCDGGVTVLRSAFLEIRENIELRSATDLNDSRTLHPKDLLDAFRATGETSVSGFVDSSVKEGDSVQVSVFANMLGDSFTDRPLIEQIRSTTPLPSPAPSSTPSPAISPTPGAEEELNESVLNESAGSDANESDALSNATGSLNES